MDPLNHQAAGLFGSMIELTGAPPLADWLTPARPAPESRSDAFDFTAGDGETHRVRRVVPDTAPGTELGLHDDPARQRSRRLSPSTRAKSSATCCAGS